MPGIKATSELQVGAVAPSQETTGCAHRTADELLGCSPPSEMLIEVPHNYRFLLAGQLGGMLLVVPGL
jgi:hypothetical protein